MPPLALPDPRDPDAPPVSAASFARLTGIPKATILNRYYQLATAAQDAAALTRVEILAALTQGRERRVLISLVLPDGRTLTGGVREVIRQVLEDPALRWGRPERWLGSSAIRARLRRIPGWPERLSPAAVRWAFGFQPDAGPTGSPAAAPE